MQVWLRQRLSPRKLLRGSCPLALGHPHTMVKKTKTWDQHETDHIATIIEYFNLQLTSGHVPNEETDPIFKMTCQQVIESISERFSPNTEIDTEDAKKVTQLLRESRLPQKAFATMQLRFLECVKIKPGVNKAPSLRARGGAQMEQVYMHLQNFLTEEEWSVLEKGTLDNAIDVIAKKALDVECHYPSNLTLQLGAPRHPSHCTCMYSTNLHDLVQLTE